MADINSQTVHTGNTISIRVGNVEVGRAQTLSSQRDFGTEGLYELGNYMPVEHDFLKFTGTAALTRMRIRKDTLATIGLAPLGSEVLQTAIFDIVVESNIDGSIIEIYQGCSIQNYSTDYRANEYVSETANFFFLNSSNS